VPRNKATPLKESGLTSGGMIHGGDKNKNYNKNQELDAKSAAGLQKLQDNDAEIDAGIGAIDASLGRLGNIAGQMKDEAVIHSNKLDQMDTKTAKATEKQTVVNARQRHLVNDT
jgi:hypothetical protein